ncbi:MAG: hypothetical protein DHS20C01_16090 [marine bacterium B5-7]|nr:MAG: hypothetical protein DHS20C01_16090 [marine bacterium B5-7]
MNFMSDDMKHSSVSIPASAGIGLRGEHYVSMDDERPAVGWLEVHTENYFGRGGLPHHYLKRLRAHYPVSFHGVGLSLGSTDPIHENHLARIAELIDEYAPGLISEHLSWSSVDGIFMNDLLPFPYTKESLDHLIARVQHTQDVLKRSILMENPSTYLTFEEQEFTETDFLNTLAMRSGSGILLDVNNVYVCARNHGFDPYAYIDRINADHVCEIHLAGHVENRFDDGSLLIDSHNQPVSDDVWSLYRHAINRLGPVPSLIEWDVDLPDLEVLVEHACRADAIMDEVRANAA